MFQDEFCKKLNVVTTGPQPRRYPHFIRGDVLEVGVGIWSGEVAAAIQTSVLPGQLRGWDVRSHAQEASLCCCARTHSYP